MPNLEGLMKGLSTISETSSPFKLIDLFKISLEGLSKKSLSKFSQIPPLIFKLNLY